MQKEEMAVGAWCSRWFEQSRSKWSRNTEGGYQNLIYNRICPGIGKVCLSELNGELVAEFYQTLSSQGLSARSVWCVHLLLRRCVDEACREQLVEYNPVTNCAIPQVNEKHPMKLRIGQIQRYFEMAERYGVLPFVWCLKA